MFPDSKLINFKLEEKTRIKDKVTQENELLALNSKKQIDKLKLLILAAESIVKDPDSRFHWKVVYDSKSISQDKCLRFIKCHLINSDSELTGSIGEIKQKYLSIRQEILEEKARLEREKLERRTRVRKQAIASLGFEAEKTIIAELINCLNLIRADIIWVYNKDKTKRTFLYYLSSLKQQIIEGIFLLISQIYIQSRYKDTFEYYYQWFEELPPSIKFANHLYHYVLRLFSMLSDRRKLNIFQEDGEDPTQQIKSLVIALNGFLSAEVRGTVVHQKLLESVSAIHKIRNIKDFPNLIIKSNSHLLDNQGASKNINDFYILRSITKDFSEKIKELWQIFNQNYGLDFLLDHFYEQSILNFRNNEHHILLKTFITKEMLLADNL